MNANTATAATDSRSAEGARHWFKQPEVRVRSLPEPGGGAGIFEIGLSLGGTVSAGAYTAGVLDFLVEAIDAWESDKLAQPGMVQHAVRLKVMAGASGGGVCATALAKALAYEFPHVRASDPTSVQEAAAQRNPLYRLWVDQLDIDGFCADDLQDDARPDGAIVSLLHPGPLLTGCKSVASYPQGIAPAPTPVRRAWVSEPLTTFLTLTNITGVPYNVGYGSGEGVEEADRCRAAPPGANDAAARGQTYRRHADYVRLEFYYDRHSLSYKQSWPDAFVVLAHPDGLVPQCNALGDATLERSWQEVAEFARATGAFPVGFPPVALQRPAWHYLYQPVFTAQPLHGATLEMCATVLEPAWYLAGLTLTDTYRLVCVDGGALNNEPVELVRRHLAGQVGRNPREGDRACRAVIHVDPFSDTPGEPVTEVAPLQVALGSTLNALIAHARFSTQDFLAAAESRTHSRFLITAVRHGGHGEFFKGNKALATAPLAAFGGFMHHAYRRHDFFLGRRNCQRFLQKYFVLDPANPLFGPRQRGADDTGDDRMLRPIVPLCGSAAEPQPQVDWPIGALDLHEGQCQRQQLDEVLARRVRVLWERLTQNITLGPYKADLGALLSLSGGDLVNGLARRARRAVAQAIRDWELHR